MKSYKTLFGILLPFVMVASVFFALPDSGYAQTNQDWSEPTNLSNSGASTSPLMVIDSDGTFHVIWIDEYDGYKYVMSKDGVNWTIPVTVKFPFSPNNEPPRIVATTNGIIHVFWEDNKNILYYAQTRPKDFGIPTLWRSTIQLGVSVADYDFKVDPSGGLHFGFITNKDSDNDPAGVYYRRSVNGGLSWSVSQLLSASPYFRSLTEGAHIRLAVSSEAEIQNVYVVWDNPALKRIFMSTSVDLGQSWGNAQEIVKPDEKSGYETPYNAEIDIMGNRILLMWQTGQSGRRCVYNGRWSESWGIEWGNTMDLFGGSGICPIRIGFDNVNDEYSVILFKVQENLAVIAWHGNQLSNLQIQNELSNFQNPVTSDSILLGCQQAVIQDHNLFVVGCDEGSSKDIWFTSHALGSMEDWFPPSSAWSLPSVVTRVSYKIPSVSSTVDAENNVHVVWASPLTSENNDSDFSIYYAVSNKIEWSRPTQIIINLSGAPNQLSLLNDNLGRLLLAWVDTTNQNLMFSWANANRADIPPEWSSPIILPVPSKLVSSPSILSDSANNIVVAYSVPFNENRGVYIVRSADLGKNWSAPAQIFDAVSAGWDSINQPKIALTGDGRLHSLFTNFSVLQGIRPVGLYYSQSSDGGLSWNDPTELSNGQVSWSNVVADGNKALHLLWQEKNGEETSVYHRVSTDNGQTWGSPIIISSIYKKLVMNASTMDVGGQLHLLQITSDETLGIQDWMRTGSLWKLQETVDWTNELDIVNLQIFCAGITSNGYLYAIAFVEAIDSNGDPDNRLMSFGRFVDVAAPERATIPATLPTPAPSLILMDTPGSQITPTALPLAVLNDIPSTNKKNAVGIAMIVVVVVLMVFIVKPTRSR